MVLSKPEDMPPAGGGAGPKSSSLLSESESLSAGLGGNSSRGAGGGAGPTTRFGAGGGAGPTSLSALLDRDGDGDGGGEDAEGGGAGPMTRLRLSVDSGLDGRWSSSSRLRFDGCGGIAGPIEGIVGCGIEVVGLYAARLVVAWK
jgi:hypothetical protein